MKPPRVLVAALQFGVTQKVESDTRLKGQSMLGKGSLFYGGKSIVGDSATLMIQGKYISVAVLP